jgi:hypothetical protein
MGIRPCDHRRIVAFRVLSRSRTAPSHAPGLPDFIRLALAFAETVAALLFLIPRAMQGGGRALIVVLVFAILLPLFHGWYDVGVLVVYAAATWAVMTGKLLPASNQERT